jgi:hypothetical protein
MRTRKDLSTFLKLLICRQERTTKNCPAIHLQVREALLEGNSIPGFLLDGTLIPEKQLCR